MATEIFALLDSTDALQGLVKSFSDDTQADPPPFYRSDYSKYRVHCLKRNPSPIGGPLVYASLPASLKIAAGVIDAEPDGGTFTITDTSPTPDETTAAIAYNASSATVQTAIRAALTTNFSAAVVSGDAGGPYTVDRGATGAFATDLTANSDGLIPSGSTVNITNTQQGTSLLNEKWQLRLRKAMPFLCTSFTAFAGVTTAGTSIQNGSATASEVWTMTWNSDAVGGATWWAVSTQAAAADLSTVGPIAYNATESEVKAAFNLHPSLDGVDSEKVSVKQNGPGSYTITFDKSFTSNPSIGASAVANTLIVPVGYEADVGTATAESDAILGSATEADITFEIESREDSGKPRTIVRVPTKLYADLIPNSPGQTTGVDNYLTEADLADALTEIGNGSAATPSLAFANFQDSGIYTNAVSGGVYFAVDGQLQFSIDSGQISCPAVLAMTDAASTIELPAGTAANPAVNFNQASSDGNTGIYRVAADSLGISAGGTLRATVSANGLILAAGFSAPFSAKTDNYTATGTDFSLSFTIAAAKTLTLPAAASHANRMYLVKNQAASSDNLTIDPNSSEQIDGASTATVIPGACVLIQCDGAAWFTLLTSG